MTQLVETRGMSPVAKIVRQRGSLYWTALIAELFRVRHVVFVCILDITPMGMAFREHPTQNYRRYL